MRVIGWLWRALPACLILGVAGAQAQELVEPVSIHGFGSAAYGKTDGNRYAVGDEEGNYRNTEFALAVGAGLTDRLLVRSQIFLGQAEEGFETELDYAFVEWAFSDAFKLHAGRGKQPFGLYTEIFDVGTLRPFVTLPQAVYGPAGYVQEGYDGLGITGRLQLKGDWVLSYDAYGGSLGLGAYDPTPGDEAAEEEALNDMVGGRVVLETPLRGLAFGASSYTGKEHTDRHTTWGLQVEYLAEPWELRSEYVRLKDADEFRSKGLYVEASRHFGPRWQFAARYEWSDVETPALADLPTSLGEHKELALGANYWVSPGVVFKVSYHRVDGNRFARPEGAELHEALAAGDLQPRTDLFVVGAQFSF